VASTTWKPSGTRISEGKSAGASSPLPGAFASSVVGGAVAIVTWSPAETRTDRAPMLVQPTADIPMAKTIEAERIEPLSTIEVFVGVQRGSLSTHRRLDATTASLNVKTLQGALASGRSLRQPAGAPSAVECTDTEVRSKPYPIFGE
jgi:hypothetical protein